MATTAVPAPEAQASISPFARVIGVFFSPGKTFEDIVRKPSWVLPLALITILSIAVSFSINQRINWREFMSQQIEKSPRAAQMSAEQKQQQIEGGAKFSPVFTYGIGLLGPILGVLVVGLVMWGAYSRGQHKFTHRIQHHVACLSYRAGKQPTFYPNPLSETVRYCRP